MDNLHQPPVTVSVITYNSSRTVIETLDSIYRQTYPNLELVISDDCSTDDTVSICRKWIEGNKGRFTRTELITTGKNTGVSANLNRAWDACRTEWDKDIAGDDILFPNCIQDNMDYVADHPDAIVVLSRLEMFTTKHGKRITLEDTWHDYGFFDLSPEEQYHYLLYDRNTIPTPPCFFNMKELRRIGFHNDERIPLLEDYPRWLVFCRKGIPFHFFNKVTAGYRIDPESLCHGYDSPQYFKTKILFHLYYFPEEIKSEADRDKYYNLIADHIVNYYNKAFDALSRIKNSWDYKLGAFLLSPFHWLKDLFLRLRGSQD